MRIPTEPADHALRRGGQMYVDGFVLPVPVKNLAAYRRLARKAGRIWREHGALEYRECVGDDLGAQGMPRTFGQTVDLKRGETVVFSWIVYRSKAHRDRVNAKVMTDPRIDRMMQDPAQAPFDATRMLYAGFRMVVDV
jgi:uncharacterized protein YbaA (DUF1428 family)